MVEDDTFTYQGKPRPAAQKVTAPHSLITKERTQKLELLIHLLSNLPQALVVCGPEGIGKTTLLEVLQQRKTDVWHYCPIQGNAALSFESVQRQLAVVMAGGSGYSSAATQGRPKQIVLIVDNAGELVPGLITMLIQYAATNPVLKVVFALTHDELQVKRGSDRAIDDCHIVEIPPLTEKQCGDYLQYLSDKPYANVSLKAISESMVAHIYRQTHGVPGQIIVQVSGLAGTQQSGKLKWVLAAAVGGALVIAIGVMLLLSASTKDDKETPTPVAVGNKQEKVETAAAKPAEQITLTLPPAPQVVPTPAMPAYETPVKENNEPKNTPSITTQNDAHKEVQPLAVPAANSGPAPEPIVTQPVNVPPAATAPAPPKANAMPIVPAPVEAPKEKPKQQEPNKAVNNVEVVPEKQNNKQQAKEPVQNQIAKTPEAVPQKTAEQLWAAREKLKQAELDPALSNTNAPAVNPQPPVPPKPAEIVPAPAVQPIETAPAASVSPTQPATEGNFTLQLMVLSKQSSVNEIFSKHPAMASDIRVINVVVNGKEKFILEYGLYPDSASANQARQSLPFEFRRALVRKK
ncbi:MAG: hypothetical protein ACXWF8_04180 [Methylobacter sp.]